MAKKLSWTKIILNTFLEKYQVKKKLGGDINGIE